MALLVKFIEIVLIFMVIRSFLGILSIAGRRRKPSSHQPSDSKRFDGNKSDISDADYEEIP